MTGTADHRRVAVIGGGLAGLAAASALAPRGFRVVVYEARQRLGGRASSFTDATTGQVIDACQHVSMGCCTNFAHFCQTVGINHFLARQPCLHFITPDGRISRFGADRLPVPLHLARSLLRAHYLTPGDKIRIGWGMLQLLRARADDDAPLLPWLKKNRQNRRVIDRFWSVVLVSALNESINRLGLKYARKVFIDGFLRHRHGFEVFLPTVPLARLYGAELLAWFANHSTAIETNASVAGLESDGRIIQRIRFRTGVPQSADWYILAVPFDRVVDLLPAGLVASQPAFDHLRHLEVSPITSVHCWFDRPVMAQSHLVLVDGIGHWIFNKGQVAEGEHYLQVVISASRTLQNWGHEEIQRRILSELRNLLPEAARAMLVRTRVITERTATFAPVPGVDRWRPKQETVLANLLLAGDWTDTGWPATMEGAVRSGYLAAEAILRRVGRAETIVRPDLGFTSPGLD